MSGGYGHGGSTGKFIANNCITQMTTAVNASYYQNVYFNNCQFNYMTSASSNGLSVFKNCSFNVATITTGMGIQYGNIYAEDCTFNRIPLGLYECRGELVNCTFNKGGVAPTTDISQTSDVLLIGCTLGGDSQCDMVGKNSVKRNEKVVALNIGGVSGSHKSWLTQGYIASDTGTPYGPLSSTLKFTPSSATFATYWDEQIYCPANKYTYIDVYMKQSATGMSEIPKCQLIDPSDALLTGTPISTISMIDDLNWQHFLISYKPTYSRSVYLRIRGANATGNWWAGYVVRET
jgi:hypothetical protein